jgi:hypothetical protein
VTLSGYRDAYYELSGKASDVARQLAFAGIALIWIFHRESGNPVNIPQQLILPAALLICGLAFDLLQYVSGSLIWGAFHRHYEKQLGVDSKRNISAPPYFNWPHIFFFWSKFVFVLLGYFLLLKYILSMLQPS